MNKPLKRTLLFGGASAVILAAVAYFKTAQRVNDSYAIWQATDAVAAYYVRHDCRFPTQWSDIADSEEINLPIKHIREKVTIDFSSHPPQITALSNNAPFYNNPTKELQTLISERELSIEQRTSSYWIHLPTAEEQENLPPFQLPTKKEAPIIGAPSHKNLF